MMNTRVGRILTILGFAIGLLAAVYGLGAFLSSCGKDSVTIPDETKQQTTIDPNQGIVSVTPVEPTVDPVDAKLFAVSCHAGSTMRVKYLGTGETGVTTWWSTFDDQHTAIGKEHTTVVAGGIVEREFGACAQSDANGGGRFVGACFFDKRGNPFVPSRSPNLVQECRNPNPTPTPTPPPNCEQYKDPQFLGALKLMNETATTEDVVKGTITPIGILLPSLPQTVNRLASPFTYNVLDTVNKAPRGVDLYCPVEHVFSIEIPALECVARWIQDTEPTFVSEDKPGTCGPDGLVCEESHLKHWVYYETNSCTQERRVKEGSAFTTTVTNECPGAACGTCYYNVPGDDGKERCMDLPGFISWNQRNHLCALIWPGVAKNGFNLNPGQSSPGCLSKHDD